MSYGTTFNKAEAFALLRDRGAKGAVVSYSGGNDEGGVDDVILILEDDTTVSVKETYVGYGYEDDKYVKNDKVLTPEQQRDNTLIDQLGAPVYSRYYSFAGEFYCSGEVVYDVAAYTVKMDGRESEETYHPVEDSF